MSVVAYAALTTKREEAAPGTSTGTNPPGVRSYVDALAALVPTEVLTLHALVLAVTTATTPETSAKGGTLTTITDAESLSWAFVGLIVTSIALYVVPRFRKWDRLDYFRALVPPVAFVAWTMLQRATAFDAVAPRLEPAPRTVIGLFVAMLVAGLAAVLAVRADQKGVANDAAS